MWDSFWSAWDAFAGANDYRETIQRAVAYGNDTDTTAAIAGGLAGIRWGIGGIPEAWLRGMRGRPIVEPLVEKLTESKNPIRVDWVDLKRVPGLADSPGRLGMTFLPGKDEGFLRAPSSKPRAGCPLVARGVRHRCIPAARRGLTSSRRSHVPAIGDVMSANGIELLRYPIRRRQSPRMTGRSRQPSTISGRAWRKGESVAVACRGGLGRTGTVVGCLLRDGGLDADAAVALVRASSRRDDRDRDQERFVQSWGRQ